VVWQRLREHKDYDNTFFFSRLILNASRSLSCPLLDTAQLAPDIVSGQCAMASLSSKGEPIQLGTFVRSILAACLLSISAFAQQGWWMTEPVRWVQTNLRQTDAALDPDRLVAQLADMRANVLLMGMGGLVAFYPTKTPFHYPSPDLPAGVDLFGEVLQKSHAHGIRVVGRFDLSKTSKAVYDAHPEWFFRKTDGSPAIYNGFYSTCINGGYYRDQAMKILREGLEKYDVDGLFSTCSGISHVTTAGTNSVFVIATRARGSSRPCFIVKFLKNRTVSIDVLCSSRRGR
jgi:Hypothetical glycosyl hydrolase 6